ncbi:PKD domain-containing protein [Flavobacterium sp.]|uniref:PKD domain-containing protein n=1 Tax=Flavobacterium sp. TaxID=239 RepID=UPI002612D7AA|nr:PKD domain-containing protein [Flavobacterium sp.]
MKKLFSFIFFLSSFLLFSQVQVKDTITRRANIGYDKNGNQVSFKPETPPLIQIAGAPKASYSYFWEMGDGNYSKEPTPKHTYKKTGNHKVNLTVTNNYDNGKPPKTRPKTVAINEITDTNYSEMASLADSVTYKIFNNREPVPDEEMIVVVTYKNNLDYVANGKLYLFYNDKEFKNNNFELTEYRAHFNEKETIEDGFACADELNDTHQFLASTSNEVSLKTNSFVKEENLEMTLLECKSQFRNANVLEFDGMNPNETRNVFFTFKTTPEMIKDTSATVKMRGVYVPDRNYKNYKKKTLEMEIVTSHDPNKMSSNGLFMNYRLVRFKKLNFKIKFQNDGEGPARTIRLETDIPDMLDKKTLQIVDSYPKCPICPKGENVTYSCLDTIIKQKQIHFTFKNIYLPGSTQKNVMEKDSTKGFVKYTMKLAKDFHKQTTRSRTSIFFDKNEPVITNYAVTRFLPGLSIGAKTGYNLFPDLKNSKSYFVAATISPYKSYRWYWQAEYQNSLHQYQSETEVKEEIRQNAAGILQLRRTTTRSEYNAVTMEIPVLMRYNINNYLGVGAGIITGVNLSEKQDLHTKVEDFEGPNTDFLLKESNTTANFKESFSQFKSGILFDFTAGFARIGPSIGARYHVSFEKNYNYWQFYALWKF